MFTQRPCALLVVETPPYLLPTSVSCVHEARKTHIHTNTHIHKDAWHRHYSEVESRLWSDFEYQLYHFLAMCHWVNYIASLSLCVLVYIMGLQILPTVSWGFIELTFIKCLSHRKHWISEREAFARFGRRAWNFNTLLQRRYQITQSGNPNRWDPWKV